MDEIVKHSNANAHLDTFRSDGQHVIGGDRVNVANKVFVEELIHQGRLSAAKVIDKVRNEVPTDTVAAVPEIGFAHHDGRVLIGVRDRAYSLHRHAVGQIAADIDVPSKFLVDFMDRREGDEPWGAKMVADVMQQTFAHLPRTKQNRDKRFLVRTVGKEARGFMTDKYRRLDSDMILDAFTTAAQQYGVFPYKGMATDVRWNIQAILGEPIEVRPGELYAWGVSLGHSDFGQGALDLSGFMLRLKCTNGLVSESQFRQVHLGKRIPDDMIFSEKTYRLDSELTASQVADTMKALFAPEAREQKVALLRASYDEKLDAKEATAQAEKALGSKEMAKSIVDAFTSADVEMMPAGQTRARWGQAISWVANQTEDMDRKMDLQKYAARVVGVA